MNDNPKIISPQISKSHKHKLHKISPWLLKTDTKTEQERKISRENKKRTMMKIFERNFMIPQLPVPLTEKDLMTTDELFKNMHELMGNQTLKDKNPISLDPQNYSPYRKLSIKIKHRVKKYDYQPPNNSIHVCSLRKSPINSIKSSDSKITSRLADFSRENSILTEIPMRNSFMNSSLYMKHMNNRERSGSEDITKLVRSVRSSLRENPSENKQNEITINQNEDADRFSLKLVNMDNKIPIADPNTTNNNNEEESKNIEFAMDEKTKKNMMKELIANMISKKKKITQCNKRNSITSLVFNNKYENIIQSNNPQHENTNANIYEKNQKDTPENTLVSQSKIAEFLKICSDEKVMPIPLLSSILNKALILENYKLNEGTGKALGKFLPVFFNLI